MTLLCPTRGGEESVPNQEAAINLALERNVRLVFLYVSNIQFLDHTAGPIDIEVIETQLDEVGDFILTIAEERAEAQGVVVDTLVKRGAFRIALEQVIEQNPDITSIIFGSGIEGTAATTDDYVQPLYDHLVNEHNLEVLVTRDGEIVEQYHPNGLAGEPTEDDASPA